MFSQALSRLSVFLRWVLIGCWWFYPVFWLVIDDSVCQHSIEKYSIVNSLVIYCRRRLHPSSEVWSCEQYCKSLFHHGLPSNPPPLPLPLPLPLNFVGKSRSKTYGRKLVSKTHSRKFTKAALGLHDTYISLSIRRLFLIACITDWSTETEKAKRQQNITQLRGNDFSP